MSKIEMRMRMTNLPILCNEFRRLRRMGVFAAKLFQSDGQKTDAEKELNKKERFPKSSPARTFRGRGDNIRIVFR